MSTYKNLADCNTLCINMFFIIVYVVLGHTLHFPLVTFDKIRSRFLIKKIYTEFSIKGGRM